MEIIYGNSDNCNTYILKKLDLCIIIDPGSDYELINDTIEGFKVLAVFLTHGHADHFCFINKINIPYSVPIFIHKKDEELLKNDSENGFLLLKTKLAKIDWTPLNLKIFDSDFEFKFLNKKIKVYLTPGHTRGHVLYEYETNLFTGDTIFLDTIGRTDFSHSNPRLIAKTLEMIAKYPNNFKIYPGHDECFTIRALKKSNPFLKFNSKK